MGVPRAETLRNTLGLGQSALPVDKDSKRQGFRELVRNLKEV